MGLPDSYWYEVRIVKKDRSASLSVGVVLPTEFHRGYKTKGMFYNGNLTNGSAALKTGYGPYLKEGDVVVLGCSRVSDRFVMTVFVNGDRVGRGFDVRTTTSDEETFTPCLAVHGKDVHVLARITDRPPSTASTNDDVNSGRPSHPFEGKWTLIEAIMDDGERLYPVPDGVEPIHVWMNIQPEEQDDKVLLHVTLRICNIKNTTLEVVSASLDGRTYHVKLTGHVTSTLLMPPPEYRQVENGLSDFHRWQSFRLDDADVDEGPTRLTVTSATNSLLLRFERFVNEDTAALNEYHH
jgi:hypothetical protein